ncbi:pyridoxal phosphate-dependent transferase [Lipomyces oligophaga]|uniref:pyridoxal phosphate-dependent transferase n=1 Tax=Lipomyces oligophaga TaxID=45792 RepID=UPI0034CD126C
MVIYNPLSDTISSSEALQYEEDYSAHNYHPLPVVFARAQGAHVWDPEGNQYLDFLSAYSAVNQGHCHPKIIAALVDQAHKVTLSSRAFSNDVFPKFARYATEYFGYEMLLPMNTGAEAVETALKLARKWAYRTKGVPADTALILSAADNFHGRTLGVISMSTDPEARENYGPFLDSLGPFAGAQPGSPHYIRYNNVEDVEAVLDREGHRVAAFLVEPIQGEAGVVVPDPDYLPRIAELCRKHNVLLICDEIQTGIARTGKLLCVEHFNIKPDIVLLGKALSGGVLPVSAVLSSKEIMLTIEPGTHGSTFGGNPLACAVAIAALQVVQEENLVERARLLGDRFISALKALEGGVIKEVRGKGLLTAIVIDNDKAGGRSAWQLCLLLKQRGLLTKPTHENIIRLAPPLVISEEDLDKGVQIIKGAVEDLASAKIQEH